MSVLTDLIYGGSNAVAGLTEGAVNDAIAKYGADKEIAFPDTAYFFPTIYAATGVKVKTLGDLIYLDLPCDALEARLANLKERGVAMSGGQTIADVYAYRTPIYRACADLVVEAGGKTLEEVCAAVLQSLIQR